MTEAFEEAFEKVAILSGLARFGTRILTRGGTKLLGKAKNVGVSAMKNPMGAVGTAAGVGFGALEVADVGSKTKQSINKPKGVNMTKDSFYSKRRV